MKFLGLVATRIINEVKGVNRVVYGDLETAWHDRVGVTGGSARAGEAALELRWNCGDSALNWRRINGGGQRWCQSEDGLLVHCHRNSVTVIPAWRC